MSKTENTLDWLMLWAIIGVFIYSLGAIGEAKRRGENLCASSKGRAEIQAHLERLYERDQTYEIQAEEFCDLNREPVTRASLIE